MKKMKQWTLLIVMMGVLLATAFAQKPNNDFRRGRQFNQNRKSGFVEKVKPVIDEQRKKLDDVFSKEDKSKVKELQAQIIKNRLDHNKVMYELREKQIKGEDVDDEMAAKFEAHRDAMDKVLQEAMLIANKYHDEIQNLLTNIEDLRPNGAGNGPGNGIGNGAGQGKGQGFRNPDDRPCDGTFQGRGQGRGEGRGYHRNSMGGNGGGFNRGFQNPLNPVGFLLWNTEKA